MVSFTSLLLVLEDCDINKIQFSPDDTIPLLGCYRKEIGLSALLITVDYVHLAHYTVLL